MKNGIRTDLPEPAIGRPLTVAVTPDPTGSVPAAFDILRTLKNPTTPFSSQ